MKKNVLLIIIALSTLDLFSQINKGNIVVSIDGNYMQSTTGNGVTSNQNVVKSKYLCVGASVGYFITDRFIVGFGLDYVSNKEDRINELNINRFYQIEKMNIKSKVLLPNIYLGYYYQIINKLYINTNLKFSYGKVKSEYYTLLAGTVDYPSDTFLETSDRYSSSYIMSIERSSEINYFSAKILPEVTYFISQNLGLCLGLGGIEYSMDDWKTDNSSWAINFNPAYWRFGIKIEI